MKYTLLSIVIPIYNSKQYIDRIIALIVKQHIDFSLIEIIIVDDGSDDGSSLLISQLKIKYNFLNIIYQYQDNKGVSSARNVGISLSSGKYIWFVDADDLIVEGCLDTIIPFLSNKIIDILCLGWKDRSGQEHAFGNKEKENLSIQNKYTLANYVWNKIFRKKNLLEKDIAFSEQIKNTEDFLFCIKALYHAKKIEFLNAICYEYCLNSSSCSMNRTQEHMISLSENTLAMQDELLDFIVKESKDNRCEDFNLIYNALYLNVNGLLFSLLRFNYPIEYICKVLDRLKKRNLYPVPKTTNSRANKFALLSNHYILYVLACKINKKIKIIK